MTTLLDQIQSQNIGPIVLEDDIGLNYIHAAAREDVERIPMATHPEESPSGHTARPSVEIGPTLSAGAESSCLFIYVSPRGVWNPVED